MCESIVEHEGTDSDTYDQFDFASQMAVLRHILFFSEGVVWDRLKSVVLKEIAALVLLEFIS